jgi:hypothetical protein
MGVVPTVNRNKLPAQWWRNQLHRRSVLGDVRMIVRYFLLTLSKKWGLRVATQHRKITKTWGTPLVSLL